MKKEDKTNVMRVLDGKKISYESHAYEPDPALSGEDIAKILGEDPEKVFKTLVTQGKSGAYYVFLTYRFDGLLLSAEPLFRSYCFSSSEYSHRCLFVFPLLSSSKLRIYKDYTP